MRYIFALLIVSVFLANSALAIDPNDPFDFPTEEIGGKDSPLFPMAQDFSEDHTKSVDQLLLEASMLFIDERPLDARTKLLRALEKEPKNFEVHLMLGGYYMVHVGHFRLALKYINQARSLFEAKFGPPPYTEPKQLDDHARLLYLVSETRLNLDNYQGALSALDEYHKYYSASWYPGSRAWVLMKLGQLDEAIKTARVGVLTGAEPGRTLNILGILLSMSGKREESLEIFDQAIMFEFAQGQLGQPATPLNNSGEVYREIFREDRAEASWLKAVSLPDGCEHVLPSLNLTAIYLEQLRFKRAKEVMDNFEACIAQFPLRNGEEHRALVHLARGRIDLHTGRVDSAVSHFSSALERRQWFGKIGTSSEDLQSAVMISLGQSLLKQNSIIKFKRDKSWGSYFSAWKKSVENKLRAWWLFRRARQILGEDLSNFEDLYVRHTDSMLEYHTLGDALSSLPLRQFKKRIETELARDNRVPAKAYYEGYLAQNMLKNGKKNDGLALIDSILSRVRKPNDDGLRAQLLSLKLANLSESSEQYRIDAAELLSLAPAELRNNGLRLPVNVSAIPTELRKELLKSAFVADPESRFIVRGEGGDMFRLVLEIEEGKELGRAEGATAAAAVDAFAEAIFVLRL